MPLPTWQYALSPARPTQFSSLQTFQRNLEQLEKRLQLEQAKKKAVDEVGPVYTSLPGGAKRNLEQKLQEIHEILQAQGGRIIGLK